MKYISTRNINIKAKGSEAVLAGLAADGGLFVPEMIPRVSEEDMRRMAEMDYQERAAFIMSLYFDELTEKELLEITTRAYSSFDGDPAPVIVLKGSLSVLELWHGKTHAFKDMALSVLPLLMTALKNKARQKEVCFLPVATSGDTGKAALEGFADVDGTAVIVFYPEGGVSAMQKQQMLTTVGSNIAVVGIEGNFDDAQNAVKAAFGSQTLNKKLSESGYKMTGANSINWGRLAPQIAYYFSAYLDLVSGNKIKMGDKINFCVPTGNFGNILAAYYAMRMGLPIGKLICASNDNKVLSDFISNGEYSTRREFLRTISPSMDILISSNLERLLFELCNRDDKVIKGYMERLKADKMYKISDEELIRLREIFAGYWANEDEDKRAIGELFDELDYICDTHTGVAFAALSKYIQQTGDKTQCVVVSTASPYKFADSVLEAIGLDVPKNEKDKLIALENETALPIPDSLLSILDLDVRCSETISANEVENVLLDFAADLLKN